jgi:uncharacterized Zn-binding protein involved in type VI secretion
LGDKVVGICTHIVMVPSLVGPVPTPLPHPYAANVTLACAMNVLIGGRPAAVLGSGLVMLPPHLPMPPGTAFGVPPTNDGKILRGSAMVLIGGRPAARIGDQAMTCMTSTPPGTAAIVGPGVPTVIIGG